MDNFYDELERKQKSNRQRLRQFHQKYPDDGITTEMKENTGNFSWRMVIVLLILSVTMLLKQTDYLNGNRTYEAVMAQIQNEEQGWPDQIKEKIESIVPKPIIQWFKGHE